MKRIFSKKVTLGLLLFIGIVSILPVFVLGIYNHPSVDDFFYSYRVRDAILSGASVGTVIKEAFYTSVQFMDEWQGLYSSAFLLALQPAVWGEGYYWITTVILVGMMALGVGMLFHALLKWVLRVETKWSYLLSFIFMVFLIQTLPSPVEGLYWYNGAANYLFFWGVLMCQCAMMIRYFYGEKLGIFSVLLAACLSFSVSGGNHVTAFAGILLNILWMILAIMKKRKIGVILPLLSGIVGFVINITAKGTSVRMDTEGQHASLVKTIAYSGFQTIACSQKFVSLSLIALLFLMTPILLMLLEKMPDQNFFKKKNLLILLLVDFMLISAMFCAPYYIFRTFGAGRLEDTVYASYIMLLILTYTYTLGVLRSTALGATLHQYRSKVAESEKNVYVLRFCLLIAMAYIAMAGKCSNNYSTGVAATQEILIGEAKAYDYQYEQRIQLYENPTVKAVEVEPFTVKPELLFFDDLREDANSWINGSMAKYYHKDSIALKKEETEEKELFHLQNEGETTQGQ